MKSIHIELSKLSLIFMLISTSFFSYKTTSAQCSIKVGSSDSALICGESAKLFIQLDWQLVNTIPLNRISCMHFPQKQIGFLGGDSGALYKTTNGGNSFNLINSPNPNCKINSIWFFNANSGLIFTDSAEIFSTNNAGVNWNKIIYPYALPDSSYTWNLKYFNSSFFINDSIGFVGGGFNSPSGISRAILHKTVNAGLTWTPISLPILKPIEKIYFTDSLIGYICTYGKVLKTYNGGQSWSTILDYQYISFNDIIFLNKDTGFLASNGLLKTMNGGITWTTVNTPFSAVSNIEFAEGGILYAYIGTDIYLSADLGTTWTKLTINASLSPMYHYLSDFTFAHGNSGVAVGFNTLNQTGFVIRLNQIDSVKWTSEIGLTDTLSASPMVNPTSPTTYFVTAYIGSCIALSDITILVDPAEISLKSSQIISCSDSLELNPTSNFTQWNAYNYQWTPSLYLSNANLRNPIAKPKTSTRYTLLATNNLGCLDTATIYLDLNFDVKAPGNKYIKCGTSTELELVEGGWTKQSLNLSPTPTSTIKDVSFPNPDTAYIINSNHIWKSTDKGKNWQLNYSSASPSGHRPIKTFFRTTKLGFLAAFNDGPMVGSILKTTDGTNWQTTTITGNYNIPSLFFPSDQLGFAIGNPGKILKSTNSGNNWAAINTGVTQSLNDIFFTSTTTGYACGASGTILKTTDAGTNWVSLNTGIISPLQCIYFISPDTGFVSGNSDTIWRTINAGATWIPYRINYNAQTNYAFKDIHFINKQQGYMVAQYSIVIPMFYGGAIFETNNAGQTWQRIKTADSTIIPNAIYSNATGFGMVVGDNGIALFKNSSANSHSWSPNIGLNQTYGSKVIASPVETKTYVVTAHIDDCFAKDSVTVNVLPFMSPATRSVEVVCGDSFTFINPNILLDIDASRQALSSWEIINNQGNKILQSKPNEAVFGNYYLPTGIYTFKCRPLVIPPPLKIRIIPIEGDSVSETIYTNSDTLIVRDFSIQQSNTYTYKWLPSQTLISPNTPTKTFGLLITSANGCFGSDSIKIIPKPLQIRFKGASFGMQQHHLICGSGIQIDSILTNYTGKNKLLLHWSEPTFVKDTNSFFPYLSPSKSGKIFVSAISNEGCESKDSIGFVIEPISIHAIDTNVTCKASFSPNLITNYMGTNALSANWQPTIDLDSSNKLKPIFTPTANRKYLLKVNTENGCMAEDSFEITLIKGLAPSLCLVGVNEQNKNQIIWNKSESKNAEKFFLYKESNITNQYIGIAELHPDSVFIFNDTNSFPLVQSNKYLLEKLDVCGILSNWSEPHKTMHLTINKGLGSSWNLIWNKYEGFEVSTYNIYRGTSPQSLLQIGTSSGSNNSYTDLDAPTGDVYYRVEFVSPNACTPQKTYNVSRSNIISNKDVSLQNQKPNFSANVYPNPTQDKLFVNIESVHTICTIQVMNLMGETLFTKTTKEPLIEIPFAEFGSGMYMVIIHSEMGNLYQLIVKE
jgi:photosystem II stability/assembly factor-like uncharacterized protein